MSRSFESWAFFLAFLLSLPSLAGPPASSPGENWGYADLAKLLESREKSAHPIRSVDALVASLPGGLRKYFTFVYASRNRFQDASPRFPRAIVFAEKLLYTFNGHPSQAGYQTIELMEFDQAKRRFELHEIQFGDSAAGGKPTISPANPTKCLACHGSDPRPIWNAYDQWPGVYASDDDHMRGDERKNYEEFLGQVRGKKGSRYALLHFPDGSEIPPYGFNSSQGPAPDKFRINLLLTKLLTQMNASRVARLFSESPFYAKLKYFLPDLVVAYQNGPNGQYLGTFGCGSATLSDLIPYFEKMNARPHGTSLLPASVFEAFGMPVDRVSLQLGATEYQYADGSQLFLEGLRMALLRQLAAEEPELARRMKHTEDADDYDYAAYPLYAHIDRLVGRYEEMAQEGSYEDSSQRQGYCDWLAEKSDQALEDLKKHGLPAAVAKSAPLDLAHRLREAEDRRVSPEIPTSCVVCHSLGQQAPLIPFEDVTALKAALEASGGRLREAILKRAAPEAVAGQRMPPTSQEDFPVLTADEYRRLAAFLRFF